MTITAFLKRLFQAPTNQAHQNSFHRALWCAPICLIAALTFSAACGSSAWAQQKAGTQQETSVASAPRLPAGNVDLEKYVAEGYAIIGPAGLISVSSQKLVLPGVDQHKGPEISLVNKSVVVMDEAGNVRNFRSLAKGVSVLVCERKDRVVIYLVSAAKGRSSHVQ